MLLRDAAADSLLASLGTVFVGGGKKQQQKKKTCKVPGKSLK